MTGGRGIRGRRAMRLVAAVAVLALVLPWAPRATLAVDPPAVAAARELARLHGGAATDYALVHEGGSPAADSGIAWSAKFVDVRTGELRIAYRLTDGRIGDTRILADRVAADVAAATAAPFEAKADRPLRDAVAAARITTTTLPVAVWLDVDVEPAEAAVRARHPEVTWLAGRPMATTLDEVRALRGELWAARRDAYAAAAAAFRTEVEAAGGTIGYVSTSAPLVFLDVPAAGVAALAERAEVRSLGLEGAWETQMSSAGATVRADWTSGSGDQGNGARVAVVEYHNVHNTGDMAGQVVRSYSTTGTLVYRSGGADHPTWVAGAVASKGSYRGTAPGADIVSASTGGYSPSLTTDRRIIAAADWSVAASGGDADIVNASIGQDTATGAEEARRYFDSIGWEDGRLVVAAAGNFSTFGNWDVVSPGTGYNVLTVGGVDDRSTGGSGDDRLWYVPGSDGANYRDRTDASWNQHGDYNKPNLSAPSVNVRTANGIYGSGTSIASPIVAGLAAQLVARAPTLATWPEGTRALLMAGALRRTPMPDGSLSADHEGVGTADARWSNRLLDNGEYGGYRIGAMNGSTVVQEISVVRGQRVRVALAWSSHTSGSSNTGKSDTLTADLDLRVIGPDGATVWGATFDNANETVDITAGSTGTMRIEIRATRFDAAEEPYGLAWAKAGPFFDADDSPFRSSIIWAFTEGIASGCTTTRFCPNDAVSREQMAAFLHRAANFPSTSADFFTDDGASSFEASINRVAAAEVASGCTATRYCPTRSVTRAEMATFLDRVLDLAPTTNDYFGDDDGSIHEDAINRLARAGIVSGCTSSRYCPDHDLTRAEMAALLRRAFGS